MPIPNPFKREKTADEELEDVERLRAKNERLRLEYSNEEIQSALKEARQKYGVSLKSFGGNVTSFMKWFKAH